MPNTKSQRFMPVFPPISFAVLALTKVFDPFEFIFICGVKEEESDALFCTWIPVGPAPFGEKTSLSSFSDFGTHLCRKPIGHRCVG